VSLAQDDGVEAADGGKSGRQCRLGARARGATRLASQAAIAQRAIETVHERVQVGDTRHRHAMRDELAGQRFDVSREFASGREQPLVRGLSGHRELLAQSRRILGQHTRRLADRLEPSEERFARSGFLLEECRRGCGHVPEVLRVELLDRRGHRREIRPRHTRPGKQVAIVVAEVTDPNQHFVPTSFDYIHDSLTSLRSIVAQDGRRSPDRLSEKI